MVGQIRSWVACRKSLLLEWFVVANFAFLVLDVFLAHSVNNFRHPAEWIPVVFSAVAAAGLAPALWQASGATLGSYAHRVGLAVGFASVVLGIGGVVYHLQSQFFSQWTLRSLVYTAPFAAPLAYSGLGFLLLLNRLVPAETEEWDRWVVFLALGGFLGVFVLALCDHAQNGFFYASEWWPVAASALAGGFLAVALVERSADFIRICFGVLALQAMVGLVGFWFHVEADVNGLSASLFENFLHGAPAFAPLLFVDLALLAAIGLSQLACDGMNPAESA
ncbi:MAG: hypothetical protein OXH99_12010 [Bryobacterales bacterium]|nr:hypothetical protein [Bryobacterales bacterium]